MQDRPEHAVGVSVVIFLKVRFGEIGHHVLLTTALDRSHLGRGGDLAAPSEPDAVMSPQHGAHRDRKSAGRPCAVAIGEGDPVGDNDEPRQGRTSRCPLQISDDVSARARNTGAGSSR